MKKAGYVLGGLMVAILMVAILMGRGSEAQTPVGGQEGWRDDNYRIVARVSEIPAGVKKQFPAAFGKSGFEMANPGQPWDAGCTSFGERPRQRLIFAGVSDQHCFVYYMRGGRGVSYKVAVFRLSGWEARFVGGINPRPRSKPLPEWKTLQAEIGNAPLESRKGYF